MPETHMEDRRINRARKKKRKKRIKMTAGLLLCLLCVLVAVISIRNAALDNTYRSEEQFNEYVKTCFAETDNMRTYTPEKEEKIISYDKPLSIAFKYPVTGLEKLDSKITARAGKVKNDFYKKYENLKKKEKTLRVLDYELFTTQRDVTSVVLTWKDQQKDGYDMTVLNEHAYTYNYSSETGEPLKGLQIFNVGYKDFFSKYLSGVFADGYANYLKDDYKKYLKVNDDNLNNYVLTDGGVRFYFQPDTVLAASAGLIAIEIPYADLEHIIKKKAEVRYIDPNKPMVAITYDDGPYPKVSNRILNCLSKHDAVATFFMLGQNVKKYPKVVQRKAQLGMEIGSHTWSHPDLLELKKKDIKAEINKTNNALIKACGQSATVFRPPYGNIDEKVLKTVDMPAILWSVDTLDWKSRKAKSVVNVVKKVEKEDGLDGRVILMHSLYPSTAKATEMLVPWLKKKGYQLVTVSELLQYRYHENPQDGKLYGYGYFYLD